MTTKRSNVTSFNVRGLNEALKRTALAKDLAYKIDICCLQETKVNELSDNIINGFRVIIIPGKCQHYRLGFAINKFWAQRLQAYESIDDRIVIATFSITNKTLMKAINVCAPHRQKVTPMKESQTPSMIIWSLS